MAIIDVEPDFEYSAKDYQVVEAVKNLQEAVVTAFKHHDRDLRAEVERVNSQIGWLIGSVALLGAVLLLWPGRSPKGSCVHDGASNT